MNLILDVDTQVDFMYKEGNLYVPDAEKIIPNIYNLMANMYLPIISTVDEHEENDEEFKVFPPHCIKNRTGALKIPETQVYSPFMTVRGDARLTDEQMLNNKQFILPKKTYNIWDEKLGNKDNMERLIEWFCPDTVHVIGVATDICVLAAVKGLCQLVNHIVIHKDCTKGLDTEKENNAIDEMRELGNVWVE